MKPIGWKIALLMAGVCVVIGTLVTRHIILIWATDHSILHGYPCEPPCWEGIVPGMTTSSEAVEVIRGLSFISQGSIYVGKVGDCGGVGWDFVLFHNGQIPNGVDWCNGVVEKIHLGVNNINIEDVILMFGPPEAIFASQGGVPEHVNYIIHILYPSQGMEFMAYTEEGISILGAETRIGGAIFFEPMALEEYIIFKFEGIDPTDIFDSLRSWKGYGDLFRLYYSPYDRFDLR